MWNAIIDLPAVGGGGSAQATHRHYDPFLVKVSGYVRLKHIIIYSNRTSSHMAFTFFTLFSFCTILRAPNVVAIG